MRRHRVQGDMIGISWGRDEGPRRPWYNGSRRFVRGRNEEGIATHRYPEVVGGGEVASSERIESQAVSLSSTEIADAFLTKNYSTLASTQVCISKDSSKISKKMQEDGGTLSAMVN